MLNLFFLFFIIIKGSLYLLNIMILQFFSSLSKPYKILVIVSIIIIIIIVTRYLTRERRLREKAEQKAILERESIPVPCTHCGSTNPNVFPIKTEPPQRMCDHCGLFFSRKEFETDNPCVYLDFSSESRDFGKVVIELYQDVVPKTVKNFYKLCCGIEKIDQETGDKHVLKKYMGTKVHYIMPSMFIQTGDYVAGDGSGGRSIYRGGQFPDENFDLKHDRAGLLSMVNFGPDTNNSQFIITQKEMPWLDGKNVVFGRVISGMDVIENIGNVAINQNNNPVEDIYIIGCGVYQK